MVAENKAPPIVKMYSLRKQPAIPLQDPIIDSKTCTGKGNQNLTLNNDLDLPLALRKGTGSCTIHPISQFVSLQNLSPQYEAFTTQLFSHGIPITVEEALSLEPRKEAMKEGMRTLKKNKDLRNRGFAKRLQDHGVEMDLYY